MKRVVIREEYYAIADGDFATAAILNQVVYWSVYKLRMDTHLEEVATRDGQFTKSEGWNWKSADELNEECMLGMSQTSVARRLVALVESGVIERRRNPHKPWERVWQYRPVWPVLEAALNDKGYSLATALSSHVDFVELIQPRISGEEIVEPVVAPHPKRIMRTPVVTMTNGLATATNIPIDYHTKITPKKLAAEAAADWPQLRWILAEEFSSKTGIALPDTNTSNQKKEAEVLWHTPLKRILHLVGDDTDAAIDIIGEAAQSAIEGGLTLASPKSLVSMVAGIISRRKLQQKKASGAGKNWS